MSEGNSKAPVQAAATPEAVQSQLVSLPSSGSDAELLLSGAMMIMTVVMRRITMRLLKKLN